MIKEKFNLTEDENKMCFQIAMRSHTMSAPYCWEKMQALAFLYTMIPVINKYYPEKEDRIEGYKRHWELFNTTPSVSGFITGLVASMEKQGAEDPNFDKSSISAVKSSLMGPFAGIGDSIFQSTWRVISMGVGLSLAAGGNILGPIVFLLMYNIPSAFVRFLGPYVGYSLGAKFMSSAAENGIMSFITKAASTVGLMTVGAMTATMVSCNIGFVFTMGGAEQSIQAMLDTIFPNLLPLLLTLFCFKLLKKKVNATLLIFGLMVFAILGTWIGIF